MSLDKLLEQIAADTAREVAAILAEAETKASAMENEVKAREDRLWQRELEILRRRFARAAAQELSAQEVACQRRLLQEREALLDELRQRLVQWLNNLPTAQEATLLRSLWRCGTARISRGVLVANARSRELLGEDAAAFRWQEEDIAGLRLISEDGRIVADFTYPALMSDFWRRWRGAAARILLGDAMLLGEPSP